MNIHVTDQAALRIYTRRVNHDLQDSYRMCGTAYGTCVAIYDHVAAHARANKSVIPIDGSRLRSGLETSSCTWTCLEHATMEMLEESKQKVRQ